MTPRWFGIALKSIDQLPKAFLSILADLGILPRFSNDLSLFQVLATFPSARTIIGITATNDKCSSVIATHAGSLIIPLARTSFRQQSSMFPIVHHLVCISPARRVHENMLS